MAKIGRAPRVYSGPRSKRFWDRIRRLPEPEQAIVYLGGCALQDVEERVWQMLEEAERQVKTMARLSQSGETVHFYPTRLARRKE